MDTLISDAIGCQKEVVRIIQEEKTADYVIALKRNQPNLHDEVVAFFKVAERSDFFLRTILSPL